MKLDVILFLCVLFFIYSCNDRNGNFSLQGVNGDFTVVANTIEHADTQQINELINTGANLRHRNPDSTQLIVKRAIKLSKIINYKFGLGYGHNVLGVAHFNKNEFEQAKSNFLKSLAFFEQLGYKKNLPSVYMNLGNVFTVTHKPDSAFYYYQQSLKLIDHDINPQSLKISIYNGISTCLMVREQHAQAAYYLSRSMKIAEELKDTNALANCYGVIGAFYEKINPDSSLMYHQKSLEYYSILNQKVQVESSLYGIAKMWLLKEQPDSAKYYFNLAANTLPSGKRTYLSKLVDIGNVYYFGGDYHKALEQYKQAESALNATSSGEDFLIVYGNLALIYHNLNQNLLAYQYKVKHYNLKDSLFNKEKLAAINYLDGQFRLTEKNSELLSKQLLITKQNSKIQKQYLGIAIAVILILLLLILLYRRKHRMALVSINAKLSGVEQERLRLAQEIHDGIVSKLTSIKMNFNALPDFKEEHIAKHFTETLQHLDDGITELRRTTHNLHPSLLQHVGLLNAWNSYIAQVNAGGKIQLTTRLNGTFPVLGADAELHLYRILQELIQNIIKHSGADKATIEITCETEQLLISIIDNGKGIDTENMMNKNSIGLRNLRDRVQLLNGTMKIQKTNNGTVVNLVFQRKYLNEKTV